MSQTKRNRGRNRNRVSQDYSLTFERLEPKQLLAVTAGTSWPHFDPSALNAPEIVQQENEVRNFLNKESNTAYLQDGLNDLRLIEVKNGLASTTTRFQQTFDGIPVHGAFVTVNQGPDGEFQQVHDQAYTKLQIDHVVGAQISFEMAEDIAMQNAGVGTTFTDTPVERVWFADGEGKSTLGYQLTVYGQDVAGDFLTVVDVNTGEVLMQEDRRANATGSGFVYQPNPYQQQGNGSGLSDSNDGDSPILSGLRVNVTLEGLDDGTDLLIGEFVDLATLNSPTLTDVDAASGSRIYNYTRSDPRFEQVVVYHSVDQINRYFHVLGFDDDSGPTANGIRDFPTLANAHWDNADNSFYSTGDDAIHFGDGGVDDAEDADIIAHEYGHAVQHDQNASWGGGEMGAMGEGFGDYLAASFYFDDGNASFQSAHAAAVGEWDATSYSSDSPPNLRRVDGNKMYPDDLNGSVHDDGEIWSRALWDIRGAIGGEAADQVILESHFGLPGGADMPTGAEAILLADQNLNGGANQVAIRQAFVDRGILEPLPFAGEVSLDKGFYQEVDTITIRVQDANAIEPISVTIESSSGDVETVELTSTGLFEFTATIDTSQGANAVDGELQVVLGDTVTATYLDPDDGGGNMFTSTDEAVIANVVEYPSTDTPLPITDLNTTDSVITVTDLGRVNDLDVQLDITHTWDADLDVFLTSPSGTTVELFQDIGGSGDDFIGTYLDDEADTSITSGEAPFTGNFRPVGSFADFDSESVNGDWTLSVIDDANGDTGSLNSWSMFVDVVSPGLGLVSFDQNSYNVGDDVIISVADGNATGPIDVVVTTSGGDSEIVTLTDDGGGIFLGAIMTSGDAATQDDGTLQVELANILTVSYNDLDDGNGNSGTRTDFANIRNVIDYPSQDTPIDINDNTTITSDIVVTDLGIVADVDVTLDITHTFDGDLDVFLIAPDSTRIELFQDVGGTGENFTNTILDDEADTPIGSGSAPFTGRFRPVGSLSDVDGDSITGTWTLEITDDAGADQGTFNGWILSIDVIPILPDVDVVDAGTVSEADAGTTDAVFTINLDEISAETVTVQYTTTVAGYANPATPGVDFVEVSGTATFEPGETTMDISVPILNDQLIESTEGFGLELSGPTNANLGNSVGDASIASDDGFDFGVVIDIGPEGSPIDGASVGITDTAYDAENGLGWDSTVGFNLIETARGSSVGRDFTTMRDGMFLIDMPNDTYEVTMYYGVINRNDPFDVAFEGDEYTESPGLSPNFTRTYTVVVADGQLTIQMDGGAGLNNRVKLAGIEVNMTGGSGRMFAPTPSGNNGAYWPTLGGNDNGKSDGGSVLNSKELQVASLPKSIADAVKLADDAAVKKFDLDADASKKDVERVKFLNEALEDLFI